MRTLVACLIAVLISASAGRASEADALAISANIQARHFPFASILDPIYASPTSDQIVAYTRCGDSALWTGAYLAAESFRYKVTQSPDALKNVKAALAGLKALSDLTGTNQLARCIVPIDSPYAAGIAHEEDANSVHSNPPWLWIGNPSRDQIVGAFFGLGVAFDLVDDADVKSGASDLATRLIGYISRHQWSPTDDAGNSFQTRPEELQMLLQVARHLNPANTVSGPFFVLPVSTGVEFDVLSLTSYFKFNLDYMTFYHLIRLQDNGDNRGAYATARNYTASHQNAFFNMVDRALRGPDAARDSETRTLLDQWLQRSRRDFYVDDSSKVPVCGDRACQPIPVPLRGPATFLWEVDPFQLKGGGSGIVESAGVDYILPYWMARYYGVIAQSGIQSAAAPTNAIASASLASLYGQNLASTTAQAGSLPLPLSLGGINLVATDSAGMARNVPLLYVSPTQINFLVPDGMAGGSAVFVVGGGPATQELSRHAATCCARPLQHERHRFRCRRRPRRLPSGSHLAAVAGPCLSMHRQRLRFRAHRCRSGPPRLRQFLRHRNSQRRIALKRHGVHQRRYTPRPLRRPVPQLRRTRPGQRRPAPQFARSRRGKGRSHHRRTNF